MDIKKTIKDCKKICIENYDFLKIRLVAAGCTITTLSILGFAALEIGCLHNNFDLKKYQKSLERIMNESQKKGLIIRDDDFIIKKPRKIKISKYDSIIKREARKRGLDWILLSAQIKQESGFNRWARSRKGARGLSQFMPGTAKILGYSEKDMDDPKKVIEAQSKHMRNLSNLIKYDLKIVNPDEKTKLVLASYNAGYGNIKDAVRIIREAKKGKINYPIIRWRYNKKKKRKEKKRINTIFIKHFKKFPKNWDNGYSKILKKITGNKNSKETINYVSKILRYYKKYKSL